MFHVVITPWKIVGYLGVALFAGRWLVQIAASTWQQRSVMPQLFWYMSLVGSLLLLAYFIFGKNDSVGILSNLTPSFVAAYNLFLIRKEERRNRALCEPGEPAIDEAGESLAGSRASHPTPG